LKSIARNVKISTNVCQFAHRYNKNYTELLKNSTPVENFNTSHYSMIYCKLSVFH